MNRERIAAVVEPLLAEYALELDDLEIVPAGKRLVLRITVDGDGPHGHGPLLDDIAQATRGLSEALDDSGVAGERAYTLEVSSRGTSRPLTRPAHWRRNRGRLVEVDGQTPGSEDVAKVTGRISETDETGVVLNVDGEQQRWEFEQISKAVVQVELNRPVEEE